MKFVLNVIRSTQASRNLQGLTDVLISSTENMVLSKFVANKFTFKKVEVAAISTLFKCRRVPGGMMSVKLAGVRCKDNECLVPA